LIEIMIVLLVVGILLAIAVPGFLKAREVGRARSCQENLSKMDGAKEQYAMESNLAPGESVPGGLNDLVGPESFLKRMPFCPGGGNYELNPIGVEPTCDYAKPAFAPDHSL
jgi:type II secretory pathway pseudopilin PulG